MGRGKDEDQALVRAGGGYEMYGLFMLGLHLDWALPRTLPLGLLKTICASYVLEEGLESPKFFLGDIAECVSNWDVDVCRGGSEDSEPHKIKADKNLFSLC